jgi:1-acyl-sn-glycerol-3-phosphate acyltransferase
MLRSTLFNACFYLWTAGLALLHAPLVLLVGRRFLVRSLHVWSRGVVGLMRVTAGITLEVRGQERLPSGPAIVAAKHQSAFDTTVWHHLLPDPAIVLKRELMWIPIYGWIAYRLRMIPVDRRAGSKAIRGMVKAAEAAAAQGRHIVIFPQGTRVAPGVPAEAAPYHPGTAALYARLGLPVVPVALNTGLFWPRRSFRRRPGRMVIEYLEPIPPGLGRDEFQATLAQRIETATRRLEAEAMAAGVRPASVPA